MKWHKTSEEIPEKDRECLCRRTEISRSKNVYYTFCICEFKSFPYFDEFDDKWIRDFDCVPLKKSEFEHWVYLDELNKDLGG